MRANPQIFMDNGRLRPNYPGKFVGVERLVRATQWSEPIDQPNLGGVAHIFAPQGGANAAFTSGVFVKGVVMSFG